MKIIVGVALLAAEAALLFVPGMAPVGMWLLAHTASMAVFTSIAVGVAATAAGLVIGGIAEMLHHTPGSAIASRNPLAPWQVIYGQQMVGGTIVDIGETGSHDKYLHLVIVTAAHQCQSFDGLWLDGKEVHLSGNVLSGATDDNSTHYDLSGMPYNFKGRVYAQAFLGTPDQAACQDYITRSNGHWTSSHTLSGRAYIYLRLTYDTNVFPNGMPQVKTLWHGKNDILDPRDGTCKYTTNAALCINDFLMNQDYGVRCNITEVNQPALIAAANLCDSYTTSGTIEPLYALNGVFNLQSTPGEILNNMLSACAGQISYNAGQFSIYAAAWRGASAQIDQTDLIAPIKYRSKRKVRELYNCVRGTFLSPYGPIATRGPGVTTGQINPWDGQWTYTDIPEYAEDVDHGYASDAWYTADGQSLYLNTKFPFTTSVSTCQRLAKIMLERNRQQGSGTIQLSLASYGIQPLDIIQFSYPRFGWVDKLFEVAGTRLTFKQDGDNPPVPIVELDIAETDPRVYSWNGAEEKNLAGQAGPLVPSSFIVPAPTDLILTDDASTAVALPDGTTMARLLVEWTAPMDPFVTSGGSIQIQYQIASGQTADWVNSGSVGGDANYKYIDGITTNTLVYVRIRSVRASGATSDWVTASRNASNAGIPGQVTNLSATESPYKTDAGMKSLVSVSFTPPANFFGTAEVYFSGYNGCDTPQLMSSGSISPIEFLCDTTHETVAISVAVLSPNNVSSDRTVAPTVYLSLDGVVSSPPAPSIAAAETALPDGSGWQFSFNALGGLQADLVSSYRIYHSENAADTHPAYYTTKAQPPTNTGTITVQEVTGDLLWYWVSAISASGLESMMTAVPFQYVDPGAAPPSSLTAVTTTATYKPVTLTNGWAINTHDQYCETQDAYNGTTFGKCKLAADAYTNPGNACDGNQSTATNFSQTHSAHYGGCVWSFSGVSVPTGATVTGVTLNITTDVLATSGISGEASVWYSTNNGSTWTSVYVQNAHPGSGRPKQTDTITLPTGTNLTQLQVMANGHGHDDIAHNIYEIVLAVTTSAYAGPEKVTGVTAKLVSNNVQISWNGLTPLSRSDLVSYQVYRSPHGGGYTLAHLQTTITPIGAATYTWTDVATHDGSFDYWVTAQNHTGYGPASDVATLFNGGSLLYSNGKTAEDLRPAAFGADVTSANTSANTAAVGSRSAGDVSGTINLGGGIALGYGTHTGNLPYNNHHVAVTGAINSSGQVLNLGGTAAGSITPIAGLMPAEAGAEKTTGKSLDILTDGSTYARTKATGLTNGGINYASGIHAGILPRGNHCSDVTGTINSGGGVNFGTSGHTGSLDLGTYISGRTADKLSYTAGGTVDSLKPAESGAEKTTGKSLDILADGTTYARVKAAGLTSGGVNYASGTHSGVLPYSNHSTAVTSTINPGGGVNVNNLVSNGDFEFGNNSNWTNLGGALVVQADSTASAGYEALITGNVTLLSDNLIPVNANARYYIEARVKDGGGAASNFYLGFGCFDSSKTRIPYSPSSSTWNYNLVSNAPHPSGWTVYSGVISGIELVGDHSVAPNDSQYTSASKFRYGTAFVKPMCLPNDGVSSGKLLIDYFKITQLPQYGDGTYVDDLKPLEAGATYGAVLGTNVKDSQGAILNEGRIKRNLIDASWWKQGVNPVSVWESNEVGTVSDSFVSATFPDGSSRIVWQATTGSGDSLQGGGWNTTGTGNIFTPDPTKTYMFACYVRPVTGSAQRVYWGTQSNTVCDLNTSSLVGNPYFVGGPSGFTAGRWYLMIGWVFPAGSTGMNSNSAGVWDCVTGQLVAGGWNFCWAAGANSGSTRAFQFYSPSSVMQFAAPQVYLCDGSEPSLQSLLSFAAVTGANPITGSNYSTIINAGSIPLDHIGDGSTYARVKGSGLTNGGINYASGTHSGYLPYGNHDVAVRNSLNTGGGLNFGAAGHTGTLPYANHHVAVRTALDTSGNVLNLGGTAAGSITPIAGLMPAESGAEKTTGKSIDILADGSNYIRTTQFSGGAPVLPNANFEVSSAIPPVGWQNIDSTAGTLSWDTSTQYSGNRSLVVTNTTSSGSPGWAGVQTVQRYKVSPGEQYKVSGWMKCATGNAPIHSQFGLNYFNGAGGWVGNLQPEINGGTPNYNSWVSYSVVGTVPAGAVSAVFAVNNYGPGVTEYDDLQFIRVSSLDDEVTDGTTYRRVKGTAVSAGGGINFTDTTHSNTAGFTNANITLGSNGSLSGAGGGAVTITGLGTTGVVGSGNHCANSDFMLSSGGIPTNFDIYNNGGISITPSVAAGGAIGTANYWRLTANALVTNTFGFMFSTAATAFGGWKANTNYVVSFYARASSNPSGCTMFDGWNHNPATKQWLQNPVLTSSWQRYVILINFSNNTIDGNGFFRIDPTSMPSGVQLDFSCVQVEQGDAPTGWAPPKISAATPISSLNFGTFINAGAIPLDHISDGGTYARVKGTGLTSGGINYASGTHTGVLPRGNHCSDVTNTIQVSGGIDFSSGLHSGKHLGNIGDYGGRYAAGEAAANNTANHAITSRVQLTSPYSVSSTGYFTGVTNFGWTATAASSSDVYNIAGALLASANTGCGKLFYAVYVDGSAVSGGGWLPSQTAYFPATGVTYSFPIAFSIGGLSAGTHTIQLYAATDGNGSATIQNGTAAYCQRIF